MLVEMLKERKRTKPEVLLGIVLSNLLGSLRRRPRMAAAAAGINKQGAVATMEPCIRHGRGANGSTVKVVMLSLQF